MTIWINALTVVVLILSWWIALNAYPNLPERIPRHFGITGEVNAWGGRWMIFLMPLIGTVIFAVNYWRLDRVAIEGVNPAPQAMQAPLRLLLLEMSVGFAYITWRTSEVAFGRA